MDVTQQMWFQNLRSRCMTNAYATYIILVYIYEIGEFSYTKQVKLIYFLVDVAYLLSQEEKKGLTTIGNV
jgi:hypothetical protein